MNDAQLLSHAVADLSQRSRLPVAFGGMTSPDGTTSVTAFHGNRTDSLRGLTVEQNRGLGGRATAELRPRMARNYASARQITHHYDSYVLGEGIGTLLAVPVIVDGVVRALLYGGVHGTWEIGGIAATPAVHAAAELARAIAENDKKQQAGPATSEVAQPEGVLSPTQREELRAAYTELRHVSAQLSNDDLRTRIQSVEHRLAALANGPAPTSAAVRLSPREIDVLAFAALGSTNAHIAAQLGIRESTVKAYLGTAMSKLDAPTRHAAVATARRQGILP